MTQKILVVDDDADLRDTLQRFLALSGFEVQPAADGIQASKILAATAVDLVVTDIIMPEKDGFGLIKELHARYPEIPVIAITGGGHSATATYLSVARQLGAKAVFSKPLDFKLVLETIQGLLVKAAP